MLFRNSANSSSLTSSPQRFTISVLRCSSMAFRLSSVRVTPFSAENFFMLRIWRMFSSASCTT